jgi:hypothetical protein
MVTARDAMTAVVCLPRRAGQQARPQLSAPGRVALLLAIALSILLNPLAAASPPDPTWIPGLYDAADFDDVVIQIGLLASACDTCSAPSLALDSLVHPLTLPGRRPLVCRSRSPKQGRAPPLV